LPSRSTIAHNHNDRELTASQMIIPTCEQRGIAGLKALVDAIWIGKDLTDSFM
jgi:hypothetical protein